MNTTPLHHLVFCLVLLGVFTPVSSATGETALVPAPYQKAVRTGRISDPRIDEASGIFVSRKNKGVLWTINDGNNAPVLYALEAGGQLLGEFYILGISENRDWEDLSGFRRNGEDFLIIADVGDNRAEYETSFIYMVKEPLVKPAEEKKNTLPLGWKMTFRYEDGPHDCEAVTVDGRNRKILLLSKRKTPPVLYELPLPEFQQDIVFTAKAVATLRSIPEPTPADLEQAYGQYRSQPTSMEISADGATLVILTYKNAYLYRRSPGQSWDEAFKSRPELISLPLPETGELVQREALGLDQATGRIVVTTEQLPAPIYTLEPLPPN